MTLAERIAEAAADMCYDEAAGNKAHYQLLLEQVAEELEARAARLEDET